jgi:hypothetical protein
MQHGASSTMGEIGACARAVPMGQGVGRVWQPPARAARRARAALLSTSLGAFGVLGQTRARQSGFFCINKGGCKSGRGRFCGARLRATRPDLNISRMRARATCSVTFHEVPRDDTCILTFCIYFTRIPKESKIHLGYISDTSRHVYLVRFLGVTLDTYQDTSRYTEIQNHDTCILDAS